MKTTKESTKTLKQFKELNKLIADFLEGNGFAPKFIEKQLKKYTSLFNKSFTYEEKSQTNPNEIIDYVDFTALEYICARRFSDEERRVFLVELFLKLGALHSCGKYRPLIAAAKRGNLKIIEILLNKGADVNQLGTINKVVDVNQIETTDGTLPVTALSVATDNQNYPLIAFLLEKNAKIYVEGCPCSPLRFALWNDDTVALDLLLTKTANEDFKKLCEELKGFKHFGKIVEKYIQFLLKLPKRSDEYLLHFIIVQNNFALLDRLMEFNGNNPDKLYEIPLDTKVNGMRSFLHLAVEFDGSGPIITYFINKYHPDLFLYTNDNDLDVETTAFALAVKNNNLEAMKAMLDGCSKEVKLKLINTCDLGLYQKSPLHYAAQIGNYEITEFLLKNGANPYQENTEGYVPLFEVMHKGHDHLLVLFKNYGVSLDAPIQFKVVSEENLIIRPIFIAIKLHQAKVLDTLCALGVNVDKCEGDPCAPVVYVIMQDNGGLDIANILIGKHKANVDCMVFHEKGLMRPIHITICHEKEHLLDCFLQYTNPSYINGEYISPFSLAMLLSQFHIARKIFNRGAIPTHEDLKLLLHCKNKEQEHLKIIQLILNHPMFSIDEYCLDNLNPLKIAIVEDNAELLQILLTRITFDVLRNMGDKFLLFDALILNRMDILKVFFNHLRQNEANFHVIEALSKLAYASSLIDETDYKNIQQLFKEAEIIRTNVVKPVFSALPTSVLPVQVSKVQFLLPPLENKQQQTNTSVQVSSEPNCFFSREPNKAPSSHAYLKLELQLSDDDIKKYKEEIRLKRKKKTETQCVTKQEDTLKECTWFDGAIHSSFVQVIDKNSKAVQYIWLADEVLEAQGCENLDAFRKDRYSFSEQCVKPLAGAKYNRQFQINNESCVINATHELKIKNSADRILLFPVKSDDTQSLLYIGAQYKKAGFHVPKDKKILQHEQAEKMSVIHIALPKNLKLQQEVSNNTNSMDI